MPRDAKGSLQDTGSPDAFDRHVTHMYLNGHWVYNPDSKFQGKTDSVSEDVSLTIVIAMTS
jgi:hypothetical protein